MFQRRDAGGDGGFRIAAEAAIEVRIDAALVCETDGVAVSAEHSERVGEAERPPPIAAWDVVQPGMRTLLMTWMTPFD